MISTSEEDSFQPHWALSNRHVQTVARLWLETSREERIEPVRIPTPDGDFLELYLDLAQGESSDCSPLVLIAHGLEGNHRAPYMRTMRQVVREKGWSSLSMVHRSCGRRLNLAPRLYHSGETHDLATVVRWAVERWPARKLFIAGYSLRGNQVAKWLGTEGDAVPANVRAAAAISPPFDLTVASAQLDQALGGIYRRFFLKTLIPKARAKAEQHPGLLDTSRFDKIRTLRDFDNAVTAPLHGFRDADDYHRRSACGPYLSGVQRPLLLLAAKDDPFGLAETLPRELCRGHRWLHAQFTRQGGHLGFVAGTPLKPSYWSELALVQFFERHGA